MSDHRARIRVTDLRWDESKQVIEGEVLACRRGLVPRKPRSWLTRTRLFFGFRVPMRMKHELLIGEDAPSNDATWLEVPEFLWHTVTRHHISLPEMPMPKEKT